MKKILILSSILLLAVVAGVLSTKAEEAPVAEGCPGFHLCIVQPKGIDKFVWGEPPHDWCPYGNCNDCCGWWLDNQDCYRVVGNPTCNCVDSPNNFEC